MRTLTAIQTALLAATVVLVTVGSRVLASGGRSLPRPIRPLPARPTDIPPNSGGSSSALPPKSLVTENIDMPPTTATATATTTTTTSVLPASSKPETATIDNSKAPARPGIDAPIYVPIYAPIYVPIYAPKSSIEWGVIGSDNGGILTDLGVVKNGVPIPDVLHVISDLQGDLIPFIETIEHVELAIVKKDGECSIWHDNLRALGVDDLKYGRHIKDFIDADWKNAPRCIKWKGGDSVLVITGDILDGGPQSKGMVHFLMALRKEARDQNGDVVILIGNHDMGVFVHDSAMASRIDLAQFAANEKEWTRFMELEFKSELPNEKDNPFSPKKVGPSSSTEDSNVKSTTKGTLQRKDSKGKGKDKARTDPSPKEDEKAESTATKGPSSMKDSKGKGKDKERANPSPEEDEKAESATGDNNVSTARQMGMEAFELKNLRIQLKKNRRDWLRDHLKINPLIAAQIGPYLFTHAGLVNYDNVGPDVKALNAAAKQKFKELVDPTAKVLKKGELFKFFTEHIKHAQYCEVVTTKDLVTTERNSMSEKGGILSQDVKFTESQLAKLSARAKAAVCAKVSAALKANGSKRIFVGHMGTASLRVQTLCKGALIQMDARSEWWRNNPGRNQVIVRINFTKDKNGKPISAIIEAIEQDPMHLKITDPTPDQLEKESRKDISNPQKEKIPKFKKRDWNPPMKLPPLGKDRKHVKWIEPSAEESV